MMQIKFNDEEEFDLKELVKRVDELEDNVKTMMHTLALLAMKDMIENHEMDDFMKFMKEQ